MCIPQMLSASSAIPSLHRLPPLLSAANALRVCPSEPYGVCCCQSASCSTCYAQSALVSSTALSAPPAGSRMCCGMWRSWRYCRRRGCPTLSHVRCQNTPTSQVRRRRPYRLRPTSTLHPQCLLTLNPTARPHLSPQLPSCSGQRHSRSPGQGSAESGVV